MDFFFVDFFLVAFFFVDFESDFVVFFLVSFLVDFVSFVVDEDELLAELFLVLFFVLFLSDVEPEDVELFFFELEALELEVLDLEELVVLVPFFRPLPEVIRWAVLSPTPFTRAIRSSLESNFPPRLRSSIMRWAITGPTPSTVCRSSRLALFTSRAIAPVAESKKTRVVANKIRGLTRNAERLSRKVVLQSKADVVSCILREAGVPQPKKG